MLYIPSMTQSRSGRRLRARIATLACIGACQSAVAGGQEAVIHYDNTKDEHCRLRHADGQPFVTCPLGVSSSIQLKDMAVSADWAPDSVNYRIEPTHGQSIHVRDSPGELVISLVERTSTGVEKPADHTPSIDAPNLIPATTSHRSPLLAANETIELPSDTEAAIASDTPVADSGNTIARAKEVGSQSSSAASDGGPAIKPPAVPASLLQQDQREFLFDFSIPESPGFVVLGLSPETVVHPRTLRELILSLKNGIDETGKYKAGLALDFAPFHLFENDKSLERYLELSVQNGADSSALPGKYTINTFARALSNMSVSIATAKGATEADGSMKLGLGVHVPIIDKSDGRNDYELLRCYGRAYSSIWADADKQGVNPESPNLDQVFGDARAKARRCFDQRSSSAGILPFGRSARATL